MSRKRRIYREILMEIGEGTTLERMKIRLAINCFMDMRQAEMYILELVSRGLIKMDGCFICLPKVYHAYGSLRGIPYFFEVLHPFMV